MQFRLSTLLLLFVVLWSSLTVFETGLGIGVFIALVVLSVGVQKMLTVPGNIPCVVAIVGTILCLLFMVLVLLPAVRIVRAAAEEAACSYRLRQIVVALHNYVQANQCLPPAYIADKNGRPMHSWRVLILPYLGYDDLYKRYHFDEPWDGPNNRKLLADRPREYVCVHDEDARAPGATQTDYVAVVGSRAAWQGDKPRPIRDVSGSMSSTIMLAEAADANIPWTEPRDISVDAIESTPTEASTAIPSSKHGDYKDVFCRRRDFSGVPVILADGSELWLSPGGLAPNVLPKYLKIDGFNDAAQQEADAANYRPPSWNDGLHLNWTNCLALLIWIASIGLWLYRALRNRRNLAANVVLGRAGERTADRQVEKEE